VKFSKNTEDIIADFRGLPHTISASSRREPAPLDSILAILQEKYKLEKPSPERTLVENWEKIFGPSLCERCHPVRIKDEHTLIISVTNQTLRSELQFMKRSVLKKIQKLENCSDIKDLVIRS
jgi:predicted nucleic acid-binding Zn ribbon protein